jgi:hypothetical protein
LPDFSLFSAPRCFAWFLLCVASIDFAFQTLYKWRMDRCLCSLPQVFTIPIIKIGWLHNVMTSGYLKREGADSHNKGRLQVPLLFLHSRPASALFIGIQEAVK